MDFFNVDQTGGGKAAIAAIVCIIILLLGVIGVLFWFIYEDKFCQKIPPIPPMTTPENYIHPVNCQTINGNYRPNIPYSQWTDSDRNTAIWLIGNYNPSLSSILQGYDNRIISQILTIYCQ